MRARVNRADRQRLDEAFRMRAGIVGRLLSCICTFPVEKHATPSEHHEFCPAHWMELAKRGCW